MRELEIKRPARLHLPCHEIHVLSIMCVGRFAETTKTEAEDSPLRSARRERRPNDRLTAWATPRVLNPLCAKLCLLPDRTVHLSRMETPASFDADTGHVRPRLCQRNASLRPARPYANHRL